MKKKLRVNPGGNLGPRWVIRDRKGRFKRNVSYRSHLRGKRAHRTKKVKKATRRLVKSILTTAIPPLSLPAKAIDSVQDVKTILTGGKA